MVDPVRPPETPEPPDVREAAAPTDPTAPASETPASDAIRTYALPTARRVVSSGLQLALASTGDLRRASIYIGLLVLGAFGPAIVALLLIVGRLGDQAGDALSAIFLGSSYGARPQPALEAALLVVALEALVGVALFFTISIDAQVMGISILGGRASERPLRLWEAIVRARQTFWRMAGAGTLVGFVSLLIQGLVVTALGGLSRSAEAADIAAAIIATLVIAPLAYVSTSIVLGDVGAMDALSRSWRLFKARRLLAVVVVLFTLVTAAIQLFALSAGLDLVVRASELLHVSLTEGALAFTAAVVLILAAVVAYGSLTFTIGAVVSAPQVTGFLGLTFFSGGLDKARGDGPRPPRGFRYVSRPMAISMVALAGIVALEIPAINSIPQPPASSMLALVRTTAESESGLIDVNGYPDVVDDASGDGTGVRAAEVDLLGAESAYVDRVPDWLLERFDCGRENVACADGVEAGDNRGFQGAYLFLDRLGAPITAGDPREFAVLLALENEVPQLTRPTDPFAGASRVFVTAPGRNDIAASRSSGDGLHPSSTRARAMWDGAQLYTLISASDLPDLPLGWEVAVLLDRGDTPTFDSLRGGSDEPLRAWEPNANIFIDDFRDFPG